MQGRRTQFWLALATLACSWRALAADDWPTAASDLAHSAHTTQAVSVKRVLDHRTIEVTMDGAPREVVLIGLAPPEEMRDYALQSTSALHSLLAGERVWIEHDATVERADEHGALNAFVYRAPDGLPVNLEMVRYGHSRRSLELSHSQAGLMLWAEDRARAARKGLWAATAELPNGAAVLRPAEVAQLVLACAAALAMQGNADAARTLYTYTLIALDADSKAARDGLAILAPRPPEARPATPDAPPSPSRVVPTPQALPPAGNCPRGGSHVSGKRDARGHLHCAKCGRYM